MQWFLSPDPLAEYYLEYSPYHFSGNNSVFWSDPTGLLWYKNNETDEYEYFFGDGEQEGYTLIGSSISYYDESTENYVNLNVQYDDDGNETGVAFRDTLDGEGNVISSETEIAFKEFIVVKGKVPEKIAEGLDIVVENIISPPVEGVQVLGQFFYGVPEVFYKAYQSGRADHIHIDKDIVVYGLKNGKLKKNIYSQSSNLSTEEKIDALVVPSIQAVSTIGLFRLELFKNMAKNMTVKGGAIKAITTPLDMATEE